MASPPFNINQSIPGDTDVVAQHPTNARTFRDVTESWLLLVSDTMGRVIIAKGNTAARDALTNKVDGTLFILSDVTPLLLQRWDGAAWANLGPVTATEAAAGILEIATQAELNAGAVTDKITTPDKLAAYAPPWATVAVDTAADLIAVKDVSDSNKLKFVTVASIPGITAFSARAESSPMGFTLGSVQTFTHGLGARAKDAWVYYQNVTAEGGYVTGDRVAATHWYDAGSRGVHTVIDSDTTVKAVVGTAAISDLTKKDATGIFSLTPANWALVIVAVK